MEYICVQNDGPYDFHTIFFVISTDDIKDTVWTERETNGNVCTDDVKHLDVEVTNSGSDKECGKLISIYWMCEN